VNESDSVSLALDAIRWPTANEYWIEFDRTIQTTFPWNGFKI
jgi:hypothetical protein